MTPHLKRSGPCNDGPWNIWVWYASWITKTTSSTETAMHEANNCSCKTKKTFCNAHDRHWKRAQATPTNAPKQSISSARPCFSLRRHHLLFGRLRNPRRRCRWRRVDVVPGADGRVHEVQELVPGPTGRRTPIHAHTMMAPPSCDMCAMHMHTCDVCYKHSHIHTYTHACLLTF